MTGETEEKLIFAPKTYQYDKMTLEEGQLVADPIEQFNKWFKEVQETKELLPESTTLSTAELPSGRISSRVVLLKELDHKGFLIFSNWDNSRKANDIKTNKYASLTFFWTEMQRQVRVEGLVEFVDRDISVEYFNTRPRGSKIGAWASPQSQVVKDRQELETLYKEYEEKFKDKGDMEIECPPKWGGIRIVPLSIEFWQGRKSRFHDRLVYSRDTIEGKWAVKRLAP